MHSVALALGTIRGPILVAAAAFLLLSYPDQTLEVYRGLIEETERTYVPLLLAFASVALLSFLLLISSLRLLDVAASTHRGVHVQGHRRLLLSFVALLASTPLIAVAIGLMDSTATPDQTFNAPLRKALIFLSIIAFIIIVFTFWPRLRSRMEYFDQWVLGRFRRMNTFQALGLASALTVLIILLVVFVPQYVSTIGAVPLACLFLAVLLVNSSLLFFIYDRHGVPAISILLAMAVFWAAIGWNQNHDIRVIASSSTAEPLDLGEAFKTWLSKRSDLAQFENRSYPVYIVAAEGGGLYAATHTAATLAALQDSCPDFAKHVFAISGVSGGSLGAAVFSGLVKTQPAPAQSECARWIKKDGPLLSSVRRYFDHDFLSPLLASSFFPDFLARFSPRSIGAFDRARALETAFETAWDASVDEKARGAFAASVKSLWDPALDAPALILNTTVVSTGDREFIAPFDLNPRLAIQHDLQIGSVVEVPVSTAVGVSARFPWLTPVAAFAIEDGVYQLGDGGYFENSGVETAHNVVDALREAFRARGEGEAAPLPPSGARDSLCAFSNEIQVAVEGKNIGVCFKLILIKAETLSASGHLTGEVPAPIRTLLSARLARGKLSHKHAFAALCGDCSGRELSYKDHVYYKRLDTRGLGLPLGWILSTGAREKIFGSIKNNQECALQAVPGVSVRRDAANGNKCLYEFISHDLGAHDKRSM